MYLASGVLVLLSTSHVLLLDVTPTRRSREVLMTKVRSAEKEEEPMGIVISSGSRAEKAPRLVAYVWGPAPEVAPNGEMVAA